MTDNILVPLPGFTLPMDFPWRVKFVEAVEEHLQKLHAAGHFQPPRFFGYYFAGENPVAVTGGWTVALDPAPLFKAMAATLDELTKGQFPFAAPQVENEPEFMLVHDRRDGACWLWRFAYGMRFVAATQPIFDQAA